MAKKARPFKRQLLGYRRDAVDAHLASVDQSIIDLRDALDRALSPDHQDLVTRATRLAVEETLGHAEADADRIRSDAEDQASRILADAYDIAAVRDAVIDLRQPTTADDDVSDSSETVRPD